MARKRLPAEEPARWFTVRGYCEEHGLEPTPQELQRVVDALMAWGEENGTEPFTGENSRTMNAFPEGIIRGALCV